MPSWNEVVKHNKPDDCWVVINDKVYDLTVWVKKHPGGPIVGYTAGTDATDAFLSFHPKFVTNKILPKYCLGSVDDPIAPIPIVKDFRKLHKELLDEGLFQANYFYYIFKVLSTLSILGLALTIMHFTYGNTYGVLAGGIMTGLFFQQSGWLSHDFGHHQVFNNRRYNNYATIFLGNFWQSFSLSWWKDKHNTHHAVPNIRNADPDVSVAPIVTWSESILDHDVDIKEPLPRFLVTNQALLFPIILTFARISWSIQSFMYAYHGKNNMKNRNLEVFGIILHYTWYFYIAFFMSGSLLNALVYILASNMTTGILLAIVFSLNHNGMPIIESTEIQGKSPKYDFFTLQAITTRNIISSVFADWFTGGLNYQVEHHFYPSLPRHNFHKVAPRVKTLCKKHNIKYHCTSFNTGISELRHTLLEVQQAAKNKLKKAT